MSKQINFFKVDCSINSDLEILLNNAKTNNIHLLSMDSKDLLLSIQEMYSIIFIKKMPLMLKVSKGQLIAQLEITHLYIKLYPELPFQMKLHRDEETLSIDYVAYLELLLTLCKKLEVDALGTENNLYGYVGPEH